MPVLIRKQKLDLQRRQERRTETRQKTGGHRKLIVTQQVNWSQAPKWSYVPGPDLSRCLLVDASTCQQTERAPWPWVRPGARIVEGQLALHGLFNAHTARHLQMGRRAMVGVIDAAAEEGDLFLDFLRECE